MPPSQARSRHENVANMVVMCGGGGRPAGAWTHIVTMESTLRCLYSRHCRALVGFYKGFFNRKRVRRKKFLEKSSLFGHIYIVYSAVAQRWWQAMHQALFMHFLIAIGPWLIVSYWITFIFDEKIIDYEIASKLFIENFSTLIIIATVTE